MLKIEEKVRILVWAEERISMKEIGSHMGWHQSAIHRVGAKAKEHPKIAIPACEKGSGRPRKLTSDVLCVLWGKFLKFQGATATDLKKNLPGAGLPFWMDNLVYLMSRFYLPKMTHFSDVSSWQKSIFLWLNLFYRNAFIFHRYLI
jgi:hypothetical protein